MSRCPTQAERAHSGKAGSYTHARTTVGKLTSTISEGELDLGYEARCSGAEQQLRSGGQKGDRKVECVLGAVC